MTHVEDNPRTLLQSFEWATETLTTTGYGAETNWDHPLMAAFVAVAQWAGADISGTRAVIVTLDSDAAVLFATAIVKDMSPEVPVLVRVSETDNLDKLHQVGADSALALSQVASQILTSHILGEERTAVGETLRLLRTKASKLAGQALRNMSVRERTGCSIVAVERNGHLQVDVGPDFEPQTDDLLYICGTAQATHRSGELYGPRHS